MKLKSSVKNLKAKTLLIIFGIIGVVFTALRFYQTTAIIDPETGFFTNKSNITVAIFYILWGITVLGGLITFYISGDSKTGAYAPRLNVLQSVASLALAVGAFSKSLELLNELKQEAFGTGLLYYVRASKEYLTFICILFGFLTCGIMIVDAVGFLTKKAFSAQLKICHLFPVIWMFCITVAYFSITVSYLNVSQLMLAIFADAFFMIFIFEYARFLTDTDANEAPWLLYATGVISAIFLAASVLPNIYFTVSGKTDMINEHCPLNIYDISAFVFVIISLITAATNKNYVSIPVAPIENTDNESEE